MQINSLSQSRTYSSSQRKRSIQFFGALLILVIAGLACGGSDSASLEQQATITALEADKIALEATNVAQQNAALAQEIDSLRATVEAQANAGAASPPAQPPPDDGAASENPVDPGNAVPAAPTPPPPPEDVLFFDDFSNNNNGWDLSARPEGVARLSQGQLLVTANRGKSMWMPIPDFEVGDEFYAEAQMTWVDGFINFSWIGWSLGQSNGSHHKFLANYRDGVRYYDNETSLFNTSYNILFNSGTPVVIGLEFINGSATLYVNGDPKDTFPIQSYGRNIGFLVFVQGNSAGGTVAIDNVVVRETR